MSKPILTQVVGELPDPPYDDSVLAGSYGFDIQVDRAQNSDSWAVCPPDVRPWMVMSWVISWAQKPAGSLPNDDEIIASRLGCTIGYFGGNRKYIMRGWSLHSDNRLYHPVVTEKVLRLVHNRDGNTKRQVKHRKKVSEEKHTASGDVTRESRVTNGLVTSESCVSNALPIPIPVPDPVPVTVPDLVLVPDPDPEEQTSTTSSKKAGRAKSKAKNSPIQYTDEFEVFWKEYPRHDAKKATFESWGKIDESERPAIMANLSLEPFAYRPTDRIPQGSKYLNQRMWEDEVITTNQKTGSMYL